MNTPHPRAAGFTLSEVATTVCMAVFGLIIALPCFTALCQRESDTAVANQLVASMALARSMAVTHGQRVLVCPDDGASRCRRDGEWSGGWMMFYDKDGNRMPDSPADIVQLEQPPLIRELRVVSSHGRPLVGFAPTGATTGTNLTLRICRGSSLHKVVVVNMAGRARVEHRHSRSCMG